MKKSENDRLMDDAHELLEDARHMLDGAVDMIGGAQAELIDASKDMRKEFDEQVREFRRQAASMKNAPKSAVKPSSDAPGQGAVDQPDDPSKWRATDPLKVLRVDVTGRQNFKVLLKAAFKVLFAGKSTFIFRKPVREV